MMELMDHDMSEENVTEFRKKSSEKRIEYYYFLFKALAFMENNDLVNADIKPLNLLIKDEANSMIKITDWGLSGYTSEYANDTTYFYNPPLKSLDMDLKNNTRHDVYSMILAIADIESPEKFYDGTVYFCFRRFMSQRCFRRI